MATSSSTTTNNDEPFDPFGLEEHKSETADSFTDPFADTSRVGQSRPTTESEKNDAMLQQQQQQRQHQPATDSLQPLRHSGSQKNTLIPPPTLHKASISSNRAFLPPKITVKLTIHEEATASALPQGSTGSSHVAVEGRIQAQIQCSDAMKNCPFRLVAEDPLDIFNVNPLFVSGMHHEVNVPKHEIGKLHLADYAVSRQVRHMPLLLERKVSTSGLKCRIAVQIRTKLTNNGNLRNIRIVVAVPEVVDGASIVIARGDGMYDELKRTLHWKIDEIPKGDSILVAAQAQVWDTAATTKSKTDAAVTSNTTTIDANILEFPVMMRCESEADPISGVEFKVVPADGYPSSVTFNTSSSFRLLHRLA